MKITSWLSGLYRAGKAEGKWPSVEDMAHDLGFKTVTLHRWMKGTRSPGALSCVKLARATGAPVDDVLTMAGHDDETRELLTG